MNGAKPHSREVSPAAGSMDQHVRATLLDSLPTPVALVDVFGNLRYANAAMRKWLPVYTESASATHFLSMFTFAPALDWTVIWTELSVSRTSTHTLQPVDTSPDPNAHSASFQAQLAFVPSVDGPMALVTLHSLAPGRAGIGSDRGREDLALAQILIDSVPAAIFAKDRQGRYVLCNQQFEEFIGRRRDELLGRGVFELWDADLARLYHAADNALFESPGSQVYEAKVRHGDGSRRDVVFHKATFNDVDGNVAGMIGVMLDVTSRKEAAERILYLAHHDVLTGLPNRHWLMQNLPQAISRAAADNTLFGVLFIDIDNFKTINDSFGHLAGDALLRAVTERIRMVLREHDILARLSGDEFMVLLSGIDQRQKAEQVAQRIHQELATPFEIQDRSEQIGASIGISLYPSDGKDAETLLKNADIAMYVAKGEGKNKYGCFSDSMYQRVKHHLEIEQALRRAIREDEFVMAYQPRVDANTGALVGLEALIRWPQADGSMVPPGEFISVAEQSAVIVDIGDIVVDRVCRQIAEWRAQQLPLVPVSINMSARQFNERRVASCLRNALARHEIDASFVEVEMTESIMAGNMDVVSGEMTALAELGIRVHLDDFGTGYASMALLHALPVDVLKIDRSLTTQLDQDGKGPIFFAAMVSMARTLGLHIIVEGVETAEQLRAAQALQCDEVQGFLVAPALSAAEAGKAFVDPAWLAGARHAFQ